METSLYTHLDAEVPPINIISQEKVPRSSRIAANLEKFHKIILAAGSVVGAGSGTTAQNVHIVREYRHKLR